MQPDDYAVSAEFYDVLQARQDEIRVHHLYGRDAGRARLGVLDIGAGTGRVTMMSLMESRVGVHAVEPARAMRAPLMTRLASLPTELRERVTVHPQTLEEAALHGVADVAICHNTIACLAPAARQALWPAVARALVPGGSLLLQLPPARLPDKDIMRVFPRQRVGRHEYGGHMLMSADGDRIRTRFDYWVRGSGNALREHIESFWMWPATLAELIGDLEKHGFAPLRRDDPALLAMTLSSGNNVLHSGRP
ncbi:class I SAM-dependent methyltransferase [Streptomyces sp. A30]|uniref:class I SAM-dependent methyltransferase n=1 Tax=Streptomyces sp. A30 TaxID=2789273 RepID=UPI00397FFF8B